MTDIFLDEKARECIDQARKALDQLTAFKSGTIVQSDGPLAASTPGSTSKFTSYGALAASIVDREVLQPCLNGRSAFQKKSGSFHSR